MQFPWQHIQVGEPSVTMGWKTCDKKVLTFWFPWYLIQLVESPTCRANLGHVEAYIGRMMPLRTPFLPAVSDTAG